MGLSHGRLLAVLGLHPASAGCALPLTKEGFQPAAMVAGPDKLVMANALGTLVFANLDDFTLEDVQFEVSRASASGAAEASNIQGITMTSPESTYVYLGAERGARILEYEWHSSHQVR